MDETHAEMLSLAPIPTDRAGLRALGRVLREDFPFFERIPSLFLNRALKKGILHGVWLADGNSRYGYAVYGYSPDLDLTHVLYLAVPAAHRNGGYGGILLQKLRETAPGRGLLLEVENPASSQADAFARRRIAFYERNGLHLISGTSISMFGYSMLLMASAEANCDNWQQYFRNLYADISGLHLIPLPIREEKL